MSRSLYVVKSSAGPCKIGIATDARGRFSSLLTASAVPLSLEFIGKCDLGECAAEIEIEAHSILGRHRQRGEWFAVSVEEAIDAVITAAARLGYELTRVNSRVASRPSQRGEPVMVRLQPEEAAEIDAWRRKQDDLPGRPEALRRLAKQALAQGKKR